MDFEHLQRTLLQAARQVRPSDAVPYAFEQRVLARLRNPRPDPLSVWSAWLWRSAVSACAFATVVGALNFSQVDELAVDVDEAEATATVELAAADLERTLFAPHPGNPEVW